MKFIFPALFLLAFLLRATSLCGQETMPLPYALYGKTPAPAASQATEVDRRIATWILTNRQQESALAQWAKEESRSSQVKLLAEKITRDNGAIRAALSAWAASPNDLATKSRSWKAIEDKLSERSLDTDLALLDNLAAEDLNAAYLKLQLDFSRKQMEACKVLSPHGSPGFRNQLENVYELAWRHEQAAIQVVKSLSGDTQVFARISLSEIDVNRK